MSPKVNEKLVCFLMSIILILTFSLAFILDSPKRRNVQNVKKVEPIRIEIPLEINFPEMNQLTLEEEEELTGAKLYASYVDEITHDIYNDVDPLLVKAIIQHESHFYPHLLNPSSGTAGLMQISPKWHTVRAKNLGVEDLLDPYGNILVGCDILHELYQSYPPNYSLNVYAGGYAYANSYAGRVSPFEKEISVIMAGIEDGSIALGGG